MRPQIHNDIKYNPLQKLVAPCINKDVNVVILAPTSSGKTICAEMFMFSCMEKGKKAVYLSPLKALTEEKKESWEHHPYDMIVMTSDYNKPKSFSSPLILMTTESLDSATRGAKGWLSNIGVVVVDEAHLIGSSGRGDALEIGLMRLTEINHEVQIVLLSATIPNAQKLGKWLTSLNGKPTKVIETDWRPVEQEHHLVTCGNKPWDVNAKVIETYKKISRKHPDKQTIVFVHSIGKGHAFSKAINAPFHYSQLSKDKKKMLEKAFSDKKISTLISTSTLAYGVNLPADIILIAGAMRGPMLVDPIDMKQEAGRGGRYGLSEKGYVYYVFEEMLAEETFKACLEVPAVSSVLYERLYFHIVSFIYREHMTLPMIRDFVAKSFDKNINVNDHLKMLSKYGIITIKENGDLEVDQVGRAAAYMYLDPLDLYMLKKNISGTKNDTWFIARAFASIPSYAYPCYIPDDIANDANTNNLELEFAHQTIVANALYKWMLGEESTGTYGTITPRLVRDIDRWTSALTLAGISKSYIDAISIMLKNGVPLSLIELVRVKGIGRKRAFRLYEKGIKKPEDIFKNKAVAMAVLGNKLYNDISLQHGKPAKFIIKY